LNIYKIKMSIIESRWQVLSNIERLMQEDFFRANILFT
jgi:hypothetical protein